MGEEEFFILLGGLSAESRFVYIIAEKSKGTAKSPAPLNNNARSVIEVDNPKDFVAALRK